MLGVQVQAPLSLVLHIVLGPPAYDATARLLGYAHRLVCAVVIKHSDPAAGKARPVVLDCRGQQDLLILGHEVHVHIWGVLAPVRMWVSQWTGLARAFRVLTDE